MQPSGISQSASLALEQIAEISLTDQFYLAGGTALAIHLKHRLSFDLDFFSNEKFDQKLLDKKLSKINGYKLGRIEEDTLLGIIGETKISFFTYHCKIIKPYIDYKKIHLLQIPDIAAMKLDAIGSRGIKRDFVDLYFISKNFTLDDCLNFYLKKYPQLKENIFHIIKSLSYFIEAEDSEMPVMLEKINWKDIKVFFEKESVRLAKKYL